MAPAADQVQEIAVLGGRGIAPATGCTGTAVGTGEADIKAASRRVVDIAGDPVAAAAASVRQIMAAHRLGLAREAARQLAGRAVHRSCPDQAAWAREPTATSGFRASSASRIA